MLSHFYYLASYAVLENAAAFARLPDIYIRPRNKMTALGYVYTVHWGSKLHLPSKSVWVGIPDAWFPSGSDTSACCRTWLGSIGVLCQALEARKNLVERRRRGRRRRTWKDEQRNSDLRWFSLTHTPGRLWERCHTLLFEINLWPSVGPVCDRFASFHWQTLIH